MQWRGLGFFRKSLYSHFLHKNSLFSFILFGIFVINNSKNPQTSQSRGDSNNNKKNSVKMNISGIEDEIFKYNNSPLEKLSGLTPTQTHELIYNPLGENSCIKFTSEINSEILDKMPFFRISEELLKIIKREGFIKLTPLGALPRKVLVELYDFMFISDEHV